MTTLLPTVTNLQLQYQVEVAVGDPNGTQLCAQACRVLFEVFHTGATAISTLVHTCPIIALEQLVDESGFAQAAFSHKQ